MPYNSTPHNQHVIFSLLTKGFYMKKCSNCDVEFKPFGPEKGCSIKCKLLEGIRKTETGCWLFRHLTSGPYSKIRWKKKWHSAHRCSYEVFKGPIPIGKWICHKCDTPKCINPDHLFVGSAKDNARDSKQKGRRKCIEGANNHFSFFSDDQVNEIRLLKNEGFSYSRLQRIFNCSYPYIFKIVKNKLRIG